MFHHTDGCPNGEECVTIRAVRGDAESILQTILRAVAAIENVPVTELESLYERIDPEALADLCSHADDAGSDVTVTFTDHGHTVVVSHDGRVCVQPGTTTHATEST
ncbi:HalOD1 output domain-containing protein [Natronorubrum sulfidifaciens]|nr:HalOD1 output domain-containing protein [Natronorubrum sulfidifaciens]